MVSRDILVKNFFHSLEILTKVDKLKLQEMFSRRMKTKVETSEVYIRNVTYSKAVRVMDKAHQFYDEYINLKIGTLNWFETISKSFRHYIYWYVSNNYIYEISDMKKRLNVSDKVYNSVIARCEREVVTRFYDEYIDDNDEVKAEIIEEFYYKGYLEDSYYDKLFKLYRYIIEDEREDLLNPDGSIKEDAILDYCMLGETIPSSVQEKIRVSVGRTREVFDSLAKANAEKFKYFLTLTFADKSEIEKHLKLNDLRNSNEYNLKFIYIDDLSSLESCNKALNTFFTNFKMYLKKYGVELFYLGCPEYQENGHVHYHFLISDIPGDFIYDVPKWLDFDYKTKKLQNGKGLKSWNYGKSDIEEIKDKYRVTTYISKYISKSLDAIDGTIYFERLNKKRYFASRNLVKPIVEINKAIDIDFEFKEVYASTRKSTFNDNEIVDILYSV